MKEKVNPRLLLLVRHLRGYTQKEAAKLIGISQGKLSKCEQGFQDFPKENLENLSSAYSFPFEFFTQSIDYAPNVNTYFRRKVTISEKTIDAFMAQIFIQIMVIDRLFEAVELPDFDLVPQCVDEHNTPLGIAQRIRRQLNIPFGPIPNLTRLLENHGVIIQKIDFGTDKIDALSTISDNQRKIIFINSSMPNDRIRYTLAHELGHIIMHLDFVVANPNEAEIEADQFASEFLMPAREIKPELFGLSLATLSQLKKKWKVSMRAIIRTARDLGVISQNHYRNFQIQFSKSGFTKSEPFPIPYEHTSLIKETIKLYKSELGYTESDLCNLSLISENDFKSWFMSKVLPMPFGIGGKWVLPKF